MTSSTLHPHIEPDERSLVAEKTCAVTEALQSFEACTVRYLGGGDFLVHVFGIDPAIDTALREITDEDDDLIDEDHSDE